MGKNRVLAIAAGTGRVGYVLVVGEGLRDWALSRKASKSPALAAAKAQTWINDLKPDVVITEKPETASRKGQHTKRLITAIANVADHNYVLDISVARVQAFKNKYEEAAALAEQFSELKPWVPKKRLFWKAEPRNTIYFEALALFRAAKDGPNAPLIAGIA